MSALSSCTPEENDDVAPTLGFLAEASSITADATVAVDAPLLFKVTGASNPTTKKNLQSLRVQSFMNNTAMIDTTVTINDDSYLGSFNYNATSTYSTEEKFTFTLTDKAGETAIKSFTITTEAAPAVGSPVTEHTNVIILGAQSNSTNGSYLDAHTGDVYLQSQAIPNSAAIDMIYYFGSTNSATLAGPTDATVNGGTGNLAMAVGMNPQNDTKFSTTGFTATEFDAMDSDLEFPSDVSSDTKATMLATGDVIAFKTADGKIGLIKIKTISAQTANSTMTIDVKIQQ